MDQSGGPSRGWLHYDPLGARESFLTAPAGGERGPPPPLAGPPPPLHLPSPHHPAPQFDPDTEKNYCSGRPVVGGWGGGDWYSWSPPAGCLQCEVCQQQFSHSQALSTHYHQFHLNPHHLSYEDRRNYRLSNFLVNVNEDVEIKTDFPGLYRCHECFNVFNKSSNLKEHLFKHLEDSFDDHCDKMVAAKISKIDKLSPEDFEDISPRKNKRKVSNQIKRNNIQSEEKFNADTIQSQRRLRRRKLNELDIEQSYEISSDSDYEVPKRASRRPKKKLHTKRHRKQLAKEKETDRNSLHLETDKETNGQDTANGRLSDDGSNRDNEENFYKVGRKNFVGSIPKQLSVMSSHASKKRRKSEKLWRLNITDHEKVDNLIQNITKPTSNFVCLKCSTSFSTFPKLMSHKLICQANNTSPMFQNFKKSERQCDKKHCSEELHKYVTESVIAVPETTFNNMHGKITDLKTEDAESFSSNQLNEIGLVKLNFSGTWSIKDTWESGGWEPNEEQLTWQPYELSSAIHKYLQLHLRGAEGKISLDKSVHPEKETRRPQETSIHPESTNELTTNLLQKVTTQVVSRKAPLITCPTVDRGLVREMAVFPWEEQRRIRDKFDSNFTARKGKRFSVNSESQSQIRQSNVANRLELKQLGKSVKYMKTGERMAFAKEKESKPERKFTLDIGKISGEWEIDHSYLCSVCGIEYEDLLEILHHKWESHPHCLVAHVNLREKVRRPPTLLYPQVGPSTVNRDNSSSEKSDGKIPFKCTKCNEDFIQTEEKDKDHAQAQFHSHLLECGGVYEQEQGTSKRKKKRKRGGGGGLKSTVRMLKKSGSSENSRDATDTDEPTPKKRMKPVPKPPTQSALIVPTHKRTTRFKETMIKEARKIAAKEKRSKANLLRKTKNLNSIFNEGNDKKVSRSDTVAKVLEHVISKVEKQKRTTSKKNIREKRLRLANKQKDNIYKEESSDSSLEESVIQSVPTTSKNIAEKSNLVITEYSDAVKVSVSYDENIPFLKDLGHVASSEDSLEVSSSPNCPLSLKRLETSLALSLVQPNGHEYDTKENIGSPKKGKYQPSRLIIPIEMKVSAIARLEDGENQENVANDLNLNSATLAAWWLHRDEIKNKFERETWIEHFDNTMKPKRRFSNLDAKKLSEISKRKIRKARSNSLDGGPNISKKIRVKAIEEIKKGKALTEVAKDLGVLPSIVSNWWTRSGVIFPQSKRKSLDTLDSSKNEETKQLSPLKKSSKTKLNKYSLDYKKDVILKISEGEDISAVARRLKIRENTVAVWWSRRDIIEKKNQHPELEDFDEEKSKLNSSSISEDTAEIVRRDRTSSIVMNKFENKNHQPEFAEYDEETQKNEASAINDEDQIKDTKAGRRKRISSTSANFGADLYKMPLEVKQSAIQRIEEGTSQVTVAKDLHVSLSTVASWWRRKEFIMKGVTSVEGTVLQPNKSMDQMIQLTMTNPSTKETTQESCKATAEIFSQSMDERILHSIPYTDKRISQSEEILRKKIGEEGHSSDKEEIGIDLGVRTESGGALPPREDTQKQSLTVTRSLSESITHFVHPEENDSENNGCQDQDVEKVEREKQVSVPIKDLGISEIEMLMTSEIKTTEAHSESAEPNPGPVLDATGAVISLEITDRQNASLSVVDTYLHFGKRSQEAPDPDEAGEDLARNWAFSPLITGPRNPLPDKGDVDKKEPSTKPITDEPSKFYNCSEKQREETAISVSKKASLASSSGLGLIVSSYSYSSSEDEL